MKQNSPSDKHLTMIKCSALLFPELAMSPTSKFLKHIAYHLKSYDIDGHVLPSHDIQNNNTDFRRIESDEELMTRLATAVNDTVASMEPERRGNLILIGVGCGARFMVAYALASKLGLIPGKDRPTIRGLLGFGIYTHLRRSKPTPAKITRLQDINHMDFNSNVAQLNGVLLYDVYTHLDSLSAETAHAREARYKKHKLNFKQHSVACCDYTKGTFYERKPDETYAIYTESSAHNFRNGYSKRDDGSYECINRLHGPGDSPVEGIVDQFLIHSGIARTQ